jgi:hypothetical protein
MGDLGLLDSLVSQRADGSLTVGRDVPDSWVGSGQQIAVSNFSTTDGSRIGVTITTRGHHTGPPTVGKGHAGSRDGRLVARCQIVAH